ncbi:MAG: pentapeptide repeat-containing protein [Candidatus Hodarchaeales archaeon]|jgi:hypothetical protein
MLLKEEIEEKVRNGRHLTNIDLKEANLCGANLQGAVLIGADLQGANLVEANLRRAYLQKANLTKAELMQANLQEANFTHAHFFRANLCGANLYDANFTKANLYEADLTAANFMRANFTDANLTYTDLPAPSMVLLANWVYLSAETRIALMRLDASAHPEGEEAFNRWADGGDCPYEDCRTHRVVNFMEDKNLWSPGPPPTLWEAMCMILDEKCPGWND